MNLKALQTIYALLMFGSTTTLVEHLSQGKVILEASVVSAFCVLGFTLGVFSKKYFGNNEKKDNEFNKLEIKFGILLGIFMGLISQLAGFYAPEKSGAILFICIAICIFPKYLEPIITKILIFLKVIDKNSKN